MKNTKTKEVIGLLLFLTFIVLVWSYGAGKDDRKTRQGKQNPIELRK